MYYVCLRRFSLRVWVAAGLVYSAYDLVWVVLAIGLGFSVCFVCVSGWLWLLGLLIDGLGG